MIGRAVMLAMAVLPSGLPCLADSAALLDTLDKTGFWEMEDRDRADDLKADIASEGAEALFASDRFVPLDAETLAEDGVADTLTLLSPYLDMRDAAPVTMETIASDGVDYRVSVNGRAYDVYTPADPADASWGLATETFARIVNDLLPDAGQDRFFVVYGGNDLFGVFLPPEILPFFDSLPPHERPYTPSRAAPDFGLPGN